MRFSEDFLLQKRFCWFGYRLATQSLHLHHHRLLRWQRRHGTRHGPTYDSVSLWQPRTTHKHLLHPPWESKSSAITINNNKHSFSLSANWHHNAIIRRLLLLFWFLFLLFGGLWFPQHSLQFTEHTPWPWIYDCQSYQRCHPGVALLLLLLDFLDR